LIELLDILTIIAPLAEGIAALSSLEAPHRDCHLPQEIRNFILALVCSSKFQNIFKYTQNGLYKQQINS
jgi:hypothetical protein